MNIIDLDNQTTLHVETEVLEKIAQTMTKQVIEVIITDNRGIAELNAEHRAKEMPTDVLSFPVEAVFSGIALETMPLGSIVISEDHVKEKADELGHSQQAEFSLLFIHGLLHLLGYDHEVDNGEMRTREKEIIETFSLPSSLILRTEEF